MGKRQYPIYNIRSCIINKGTYATKQYELKGAWSVSRTIKGKYFQNVEL